MKVQSTWHGTFKSFAARGELQAALRPELNRCVCIYIWPGYFSVRKVCIKLQSMTDVIKVVRKDKSTRDKALLSLTMSGILRVLIMSGLLGFGSFGVGILPLSFNFSSLCSIICVRSISSLIDMAHLESSLDKFSTLGTGLLLGTALGVIIPECAIFPNRPLSCVN